MFVQSDAYVEYITALLLLYALRFTDAWFLIRLIKAGRIKFRRLTEPLRPSECRRGHAYGEFFSVAIRLRFLGSFFLLCLFSVSMTMFIDEGDDDEEDQRKRKAHDVFLLSLGKRKV